MSIFKSTRAERDRLRHALRERDQRIERLRAERDKLRQERDSLDEVSGGPSFYALYSSMKRQRAWLERDRGVRHPIWEAEPKLAGRSLAASLGVRVPTLLARPGAARAPAGTRRGALYCQADRGRERAGGLRAPARGRATLLRPRRAGDQLEGNPRQVGGGPSRTGGGCRGAGLAHLPRVHHRGAASLRRSRASAAVRLEVLLHRRARRACHAERGSHPGRGRESALSSGHASSVNSARSATRTATSPGSPAPGIRAIS